MTPDLGQGACQAIEDAVVLAECLSVTRAGVEAMLADFASRRLSRVRRIVREARQLGRLNASASPVAAFVRSSLFGLVPRGYARRHLLDLNGRDAFGAQLPPVR
ncbi:MAG TPA: hypothetical protein VKG43_03475 [Acidimicrobiales bacterium]|nr:hypothetical protein [Acidimicrobiales bacterium]